MSMHLVCAMVLAHLMALVVGSVQAGKAQVLSSNLSTLVAQDAPLNEQGYQLVVRSGGGDVDMKLFIGRLLMTLDRAVEDQGAFNGFVPHFSGSVAAQSFATLQSELQAATWTTIRHVNSAEDAIAGAPTINRTNSSFFEQDHAAVGVEPSLESQAVANVHPNASTDANSSTIVNATEARELHEQKGSELTSLKEAITKPSDASMRNVTTTSSASTTAKSNETWNASVKVKVPSADAMSASPSAGSSDDESSSSENLDEAKVEHKAPNATSAKPMPKNSLLAESSSAMGVAQESFNMTLAEPAAATPSLRAGKTRHRASAASAPAAARQASGPADTKEVAANPRSEQPSLFGKVWSQIRGAVQHVLKGPEQKPLQPQAGQQQTAEGVDGKAAAIVKAYDKARQLVAEKEEAAAKAAEEAKAAARARAAAAYRNKVKGILSATGGNRDLATTARHAAQKALAGTADAVKAGDDKARVEKAASENAAVENISAEEAAADTSAPKESESEKSAMGKSAEDKVVAEKAAAQGGVEPTATKKVAAEKAAAEKAAMDNAAMGQDVAGETAAKPASVENKTEKAAEEKVAKERLAAEISTVANEHETTVEEAATKRSAAEQADTKKAKSEKVAKQREAARAERASNLAKAQQERDAKLAKVRAERAAKLAKIRAAHQAQSLEKERIKNHSLALRTQMHDGVEQSFSESRVSRAASKNLDSMLDSAPGTQAAAVAAEEALRTLGMKSPAVHLQRHAQVSAKLPDVDSLLAPAAGRFRAVQAQAKAIQEQVHAQVSAGQAALEQKTRSYKQQLAERALDSQAVANANQGIRSNIAAQSRNNTDLEQEAQRLLKARGVLRQTLDGLSPKLALAKSFLADSLNITNDDESQALKVLRPTTPAPTLEHYLGLVRQSLGVTHSDHQMALLETSSQTKARRNPLEDEEKKPNTASDVLAGRLIELKWQQESGATELSAHYSHLLEGADAYHASLLAEQGSLNTTLTALRQSNEGLESARTYLQSQVRDLESHLASFRSFVGHLGSSLRELAMRANTELEGVTLSPAPTATSRKPLPKERRIAASTQRQRKVAH